MQRWLNNPATNFGFILQDYDNPNKDDLVFSSRNSSAAADRPQLQVLFAPPDMMPSALTSDAGVLSAAAMTSNSLGSVEKSNSKKIDQALLKAEAAAPNRNLGPSPVAPAAPVVIDAAIPGFGNGFLCGVKQALRLFGPITTSRFPKPHGTLATGRRTKVAALLGSESHATQLSNRLIAIFSVATE